MTTPSTPVTVQNLLGQPKLGLDFLLWKARQELRSATGVRDPFGFYKESFNFAVSIGSCFDWAWHFHLKADPQWSARKFGDFRDHVQQECWQVIYFLDVSNTFKHAERWQPNVFAEQLQLRVAYDGDPIATLPMTIQNSFLFGRHRVVPVLMKAGEAYYFRAVAEAALKWWENFATTRCGVTLLPQAGT